MRLAIEAQRDGHFIPLGTMETLPGCGPVFMYSESWLAARNPRPLSLSIPLSARPCPERLIKPYFEGLLPEGDARKALSRELGVSVTSYFRTLAEVGGECIGAVSIRPEDDGGPLPSPGYMPLASEDMERLATSGFGLACEFAVRSRLSLAGAQAKTGLYQDPLDGLWYRPVGQAPSNRIVKPASDRFDGLADNEAYCMGLARACGLRAAAARKAKTEHPMTVTERFDRMAAQGEAIDGHPAFLRLHQEDFCQALGLLPSKKYEERNSLYLMDMERLLRRESSSPAEDIEELFKLTVFNYLIGNCDAHLKNFSVIRDQRWNGLRLAPAYDLVSTSVYPDLARVMAMKVGRHKKLDDLERSDFLVAAKDMHLGKHVAQRCIETIREAVDASAAARVDSSTAEAIALQAKGRNRRLASRTVRSGGPTIVERVDGTPASFDSGGGPASNEQKGARVPSPAKQADAAKAAIKNAPAEDPNRPPRRCSPNSEC